MKFNKATLIIAMLAACLGFTACDDNNEYVPGAPAGEHNIGFSSEQNLTLGFDQSELQVEISRANTVGELVVPIEGLMVPEFVTLPTSATFADGSATATLTLTIGEDMKPFTDYQLSFKVPEEYTNAYAEDGKSPIFNITIKKEDYKVVANGLYSAAVLWSNASWEQPVEYSAILGIYRLPNCFSNGTHWYFAFDGAENFTFTDKDGGPVTKFLCGPSHSSGAIYANVLAGNFMGYVPAEEGESTEGYFAFPFQFTCPAGSFGANYEYLDIVEWLEKPWETEVAE